MSPTLSREINGSSRPAPLNIHKDSHLIHKASSSSSQQQQRHRRHPVIIYIHSPKVIHTQAGDFMALVQKLTGLSHSAAPPTDDDSPSLPLPVPPPSNTSRKHKDTDRAAACAACDGSSSSPENCSFGGDVHVSCSSLKPTGVVSPVAFEQLPLPNPFLSEIPLFTPNASGFFCSSRSIYSYPNSSVLSPSLPNMDAAISPSVMDAMKTYHETDIFWEYANNDCLLVDE